MSLSSVNERRPVSPIPKSGYPYNRTHRMIDGRSVQVATVVEVGTTGPGDNWWSLASTFNVRPWDIIAANFDTTSPEEVNWYLREYVGCHVLGPRKRNYKFDNAKPGLIAMPLESGVIDMLIERGARDKPKKKKEDGLFDKRWPQRKADIATGKGLIERTLREAHREISRWAPNPKDFNVWKELKDYVEFDEDSYPGAPGFGDLFISIFKVFNETDPVHQQVRKMREGIHKAFAAGMASVLVAGHTPSSRGQTAHQKKFFKAGQLHAQKMTALERYQFVLALVENDRVYGIQGLDPLDYSKEDFRRHMSGHRVESMIRQEFSTNKYLFRNAK